MPLIFAYWGILLKSPIGYLIFTLEAGFGELVTVPLSRQIYNMFNKHTQL